MIFENMLSYIVAAVDKVTPPYFKVDSNLNKVKTDLLARHEYD